MSDCDCNRCNPGEPDTADLVGEINERCDRLGIPEGTPAERVEHMASRLTLVRTQRDDEVEKAHALRNQIAELKAELDAERAQLAAKPRMTDEVKLALAVLMSDTNYPDRKLAMAFLRKALA